MVSFKRICFYYTVGFLMSELMDVIDVMDYLWLPSLILSVIVYLDVKMNYKGGNK